MAFVVVLDANVLYPFTLRDTLLRAAAANLYELQWSAMILDEMERNLVDNGATTLEQAARLRATMERVFPDAMVTGFERLIAAMKNDEKDRHVAAAAVKCGAQLIVTSNVKDFADLPDGIDVQSPDEFLCNLVDLDPRSFLELLREQAADLKKPPVTFEQFLETFEKMVPNFVAAVRAIDHDYVGDANPPDDAAAHALRDACGAAVGGMFGIKIAPD